jgi:excisionase family DNA binding protein
MHHARADAPGQSEREVITADEVAALIRMTPAWVYAETRRNRIPHMRLGRYFRYRRSAIEAWMDALEEGPDQVRQLPAGGPLRSSRSARDAAEVRRIT